MASDRAPRRWPGVGTGPFTLDKLNCVDGWLDMLTTMSRGVLERFASWPRQYTVIDLNAGPGRYELPDGQVVDGTPILVLRRLARSKLKIWRALFVEADTDMAAELQYWLDDEAERLGIASDRYEVRPGDHSKVVQPWVAASVPAMRGLGLILHDPNGAPEFQLLESLTHDPQLERFDVVVYLQATPVKRVRGLPERYDTAVWQSLDAAMPRVKAHWVVREPNGSNQYALCIGSNGALPGTWNRQGFWPLESDRGSDIFERLNLTARQRKNLLQPGLFDSLTD